MIITIDQEWEHAGIDYWLQAEVDIEEVEAWTGDMNSRWPVYELGLAEVQDCKVFAYDATSQGYEIPIEEPRILETARTWAKEHAHEYV